MKKIIVSFISVTLLMFQFLYAQIDYIPVKKNSNPSKKISPYDTVPGRTKIASPSGVGTITTSVGITSACIGSGFTIDYSTTNATFIVGNVFTAQLSDELGNFSSPIVIGTLASTAVLGTISVTIPSNTIPSSSYRIRVVSNDPIITGSSSSSFTISSTNTWTGAVNTAWENAANWSCGLVPNANTDVIINSGTVIVNSNAVCKSLNVSSGVILTVNTGFALTVIQ